MPDQAPSRTVTVNGPYVEVVSRKDEPMMLHEQIATLTDPSTGEELVICRSITNPFAFTIRGSELCGVFDLKTLFSEAALHVVKGNGEPT